MSRLEIPHTETLTPSPTHTVVDLDATVQPIPKPNSESSLSVPSPTNNAHEDVNAVADAGPKLSQRKKWSLLMVFSLGFFIDVWMYSAFFVFTGPISADLTVPFEQQT